MKLKLSVFLLITILLISGGYLVWISYGQDIVDKYIITTSPTPDPYAGWKTYTNEEYGFSIKYPGDWYDRGNTTGSYYDFGNSFSYQVNLPDSIYTTDSIWVQVIENLKNPDKFVTWNNIDQFFNTYRSFNINESTITFTINGSPKIEVEKINEFIVNGKPALQVNIKPAPNTLTDVYSNVVYYILDNNQLVVVTTSKIDYRKDLPDIAEKMVKSIEFIK